MSRFKAAMLNDERVYFLSTKMVLLGYGLLQPDTGKEAVSSSLFPTFFDDHLSQKKSFCA